MLNRLFIVVGLVAIIGIVAGFIAPRFIDWSQYRERLEVLTSDALGQPVKVEGELDVSFLPQPGLRFSGVTVGPPDAPLMRVQSVSAKFSLLDFLRDHYEVTQLVISKPVVNLTIGEDGRFDSLVALPKEVTAGNVAVENATIEAGVIRLTDARSQTKWEAEDFAGTLQMAGPRGPFALQGRFRSAGTGFETRINTSAMNAEGTMQLSSFLRPLNGGFSASAQGLVETQNELSFLGDTELRFAADNAEGEAGLRGDMVLTAKLSADSARLLFSDYLLIPDENRPATRLSGAGEIILGQSPHFNLVLSGGVMGLVPRDALAQEDQDRNELLALIEELPGFFVPDIPGRVGVDITELDLRAFKLRDVRLDANSDARGWTITTLDGRLPGNTLTSLTGRLSVAGGTPVFDGQLAMQTDRLDSFAAQWRSASENEVLFNVAASLKGRVSLTRGEVALSNGRLEIDGTGHRVSGRLVTGEAAAVDLNAQLSALSPDQSAILESLLPKGREAVAFRETFAQGSFDISADEAVIWDVPGTGLAAQGTWQGNALSFSQLHADDWGGVGIDFAGHYDGPLSAAEIWGAGAVSLARASSARIDNVLDQFRLQPELQAALARLSPAAIDFELSPPEDGAQSLIFTGRAGAVDLEAEFDFSGGLAHAADAPLLLNVDAAADDAGALAEVLGLASLPIDSRGQPVNLTAQLDGTWRNSLDIDARISGGDDAVSYAGNAIVTDLGNLRGNGAVEFNLSDIAPLAAATGAEDVAAGPVRGTAALEFGDGRVSANDIVAQVGETDVIGLLTRASGAAGPEIGGAISFSRLELSQVVEALVGHAALAIDGPVWPVGPFALAQNGREGGGAVTVSAREVFVDATPYATDLVFDLVWNETEMRLRDLRAELSGGEIDANVTFCCHGPIADRQLSGRAQFSNVEIDAVLPQAARDAFSGTISGALQLEATGASPSEFMGSMTGEGSFGVSELTVKGFGPRAFGALLDVDNPLEAEDGTLAGSALEALQGDALQVPRVNGVFTVAGGNVRAANVLAEAEGATVIGSLDVSLDDLAIDGRWVMTPDAEARIMDAAQSGTAEVSAAISGVWSDPQVDYDVTALVDGVKFRAYAEEVDRLEARRAEQQARAQEAAAERARLREEFARQQEERAAEEARQQEAARRAAAEAAAEAARREREQQQEQQRQEQDALDLLLPPTSDGRSDVNQFNPDFRLPKVTFDPGRQF